MIQIQTSLRDKPRQAKEPGSEEETLAVSVGAGTEEVAENQHEEPKNFSVMHGSTRHLWVKPASKQGASRETR